MRSKSRRGIRSPLRFDSVTPLLASQDPALRYFARRDLAGEDPGPVSVLWDLPGARKILRKQTPDGSWPRPAAQKKHPAINYGLIETWKVYRLLVDLYGFTREHPQVEKAAEFLLSCQTPEGDIRGMLANQYATYYTGAILGLLIRSGYGDDPRVERGMRWLLSMRQDDGAWSVPILTHTFTRQRIYELTSRAEVPVLTQRSKPFSHNATGMVLRAFAAHGRHRESDAARVAARLLVSRFFEPDAYTSYHAAAYWVRFQYPFWWNNLVSAMDTVSRIGLEASEDKIAQGLAWLVEHQEPDRLWLARLSAQAG